MQTDQLEITGAFTVTPALHGDDRGHFAETFRADAFMAATGHAFDLQQANTSFSARGVIRGVHFALVPPGQAKYVQCLAGTILDVVVDVRVGSPTFGQHVAVELDDRTRRALYLAEGLGHAFCALSPTATVNYLCSTSYNPAREFGVNPLDPELALPWPTEAPIVSDKDAAAPTLAEARELGQLPDYTATMDYLDGLRRG
ncbi:MAG TPA: dTDP-4-dehydrorhamnose 3,5-epimerase [Mycobacteriales bacterium]|jgi:dTDP-4-dehydrorhamnose 3,5-epimerase|nr:dTDP-4-dehydrorhamnose 3,5-epimerase [Mycobacteriales bacterium]